MDDKEAENKRLIALVSKLNDQLSRFKKEKHEAINDAIRWRRLVQDAVKQIPYVFRGFPYEWRWVPLMSMFLFGKTSAQNLCVELELDPDEKMEEGDGWPCRMCGFSPDGDEEEDDG